MTADELSFSKHGLQDMGYEAPRKEIPAEFAAQQCGCTCSYCGALCSWDCHSDCLAGDLASECYTNDRLMNYDGEHVDKQYQGW